MQSLGCCLGAVVPCSFLVAVTCFGLGSCFSCRLSRGKVLGPGLPAPSCEEGGSGQSCPGHDVCSPANQPAWFFLCQSTAHLNLVHQWQSCPQSHTRTWVITVRPIRGGYPVDHSLRIEYQSIRVIIEVYAYTNQCSGRCFWLSLRIKDQKCLLYTQRLAVRNTC